MRKLLLLLMLLLVPLPAAADSSFIQSGGAGTPLPGAGTPAALPQQTWDFTAGVGETYTVRSGATRVVACIAGGSGGGGACTAGDTAGLSGATAGDGGYYCVLFTSSTLSSAITYTIGGGGSAGICAASPLAGGFGGNSQILLGGKNIATIFGSGGAAPHPPP